VTAPAYRRTSFSRTLFALGAVALLALFALAALLLGGAFGGPRATSRGDGHTLDVAANGDHEHSAPAIHALRQQPSLRARGASFAVLAAAAVVAACVFRRLRLARADRSRTPRVAGLPPGRAPPTLRIA
jgi:hypothetical protein